MSNIYDLYWNFQSGRTTQLEERITNFLHEVMVATRMLPEKETLDLFKIYTRKNLAIRWDYSNEDNAISFTFYAKNIDNPAKFESGKFEFPAACVENCNKLLQLFNCDLILGNFGWISLQDSTMTVTLIPDKEAKVRVVDRFKEILTDAFPKCKIDDYLLLHRIDDGKFADYYDRGYISIAVPM